MYIAQSTKKTVTKRDPYKHSEIMRIMERDFLQLSLRRCGPWHLRITKLQSRFCSAVTNQSCLKSFGSNQQVRSQELFPSDFFFFFAHRKSLKQIWSRSIFLFVSDTDVCHKLWHQERLRLWSQGFSHGHTAISRPPSGTLLCFCCVTE